MQSYTANYEYACSLVKLMLDREARIDSSNDKHLYNTSGLACSLFTLDYSTLSNDATRSRIEQRLSNKEDDNVAFIARLRGTYIDIGIALGASFLSEVTSNIIASIAQLSIAESSSEHKRTQKKIVQFFSKYPYIIVCVLGSKSYQEKFINYTGSLLRAVSVQGSH